MINVNIQNIAESQSQTLSTPNGVQFDVVTLITGASRVSLFFNAGTGQSVADAINAAIMPVMSEAAK